MENNNEYITTSDNETITLGDNRRSGILNYSLSQVATLLGESESKIRYYTNIFDDLLKIPVTNKELTYNNKDIDKLEFLLRLKNKGLSIKEIQSYCNEIALDEIDIQENTKSISIDDFANLLLKKQNDQYNQLKSEIFEYIDNSKKDLLDNVSKQIQNEMSALKDDFKNILNESLETIKNEFDKNNADVNEHLNNMSLHFDEKSEKLADSIIFKMNKYETVMQTAYSIQEDMDRETRKSPGFFAKLLGAK